MTVYAEISDITVLRSLTAQQQEAAEKLLPTASAKLRLIARKYGKDIDSMIADPETGEDYALAVKDVIVQSVCRALDSLASSGNVVQRTESIGAYSLTATYLNAGQSLYFLKNELKALSLKRQTYGAVDLYGLSEE